LWDEAQKSTELGSLRIAAENLSTLLLASIGCGAAGAAWSLTLNEVDCWNSNGEGSQRNDSKELHVDLMIEDIWQKMGICE
jgi:hypothetical protein